MNADRLTPRLLKHLQHIAAHFGRDRMEADDIYGEMLEAIVRLSSDEDSNSRILTRARWIALSHVKAQRIYTKHVGPQSDAEVSFIENDEEEVECLFADETTPEQEAEDLEKVAALEIAIATLDTTDQRIVRLLKDGFQPVDIARKLDVSRSAISQRMTRIARQLAAAGFTPASM